MRCNSATRLENGSAWRLALSGKVQSGLRNCDSSRLGPVATVRVAYFNFTKSAFYSIMHLFVSYGFHTLERLSPFAGSNDFSLELTRSSFSLRYILILCTHTYMYVHISNGWISLFILLMLSHIDFFPTKWKFRYCHVMVNVSYPAAWKFLIKSFVNISVNCCETLTQFRYVFVGQINIKCHPYVGTSLLVTRPENGVQNS